MKNLVFQYYIPYESFDADMGGIKLPEWAHAGSRSAKAYADYCGAEYELSHDRFFDQIDPRLDSIKIVFDKKYDEYDHILSIDLDMLIHSGVGENIFEKDIKDVAMVHELGVHTGGPAGWLSRVMYQPLYKRGIIAYGKHLWGEDWMFPKSKLYPDEKFRYMNGGLQLWSKEGRLKARKHFTSVDNYILHTRYTEQMYINLQLSNPEFDVTELDWKWNSLATRHWKINFPKGKFLHFINATKHQMPRFA